MTGTPLINYNSLPTHYNSEMTQRVFNSAEARYSTLGLEYLRNLDIEAKRWQKIACSCYILGVITVIGGIVGVVMMGVYSNAQLDPYTYGSSGAVFLSICAIPFFVGAAFMTDANKNIRFIQSSPLCNPAGIARIRQNLLQQPPIFEDSKHFVGMGIMPEEVHTQYDELKNEKLQIDAKRKPIEGLHDETISNNSSLQNLKNQCDADTLDWEGRWNEFRVVLEDPRDGIPQSLNILALD